MGHRANFVLISGGEARAFYDQWAALGSTYSFAAGPEAAQQAAQVSSQPTNELLDWAFAEAGYLIDFDMKKGIVFGMPEPLGLDEIDEVPPEAFDGLDGAEAALERGPADFLTAIAPNWKGWLLCWDERGVDAFSEHLRGRGISTIKCQPPSHRANCTAESHQA
jgi:hypothetical protein